MTPGDDLEPTSPGSDPTEDHADDWSGDWDDDWSDDWGDGRNAGPGRDDPRVAAGIEHLQRAAREVIAASRALLDAAEDLVDQPDGISRLAGVVADLGDLAGRTVRAATGGVGAPRPRSGVADPGGPEGPDDDPPVQRIPVS